jgi:hypothetical protein
MTHAIIHHCPNSPEILDFTEEVIVALLGRDVWVEVADGESGEFSVEVDGERVITLHDHRLPSVDSVLDAVADAGSLAMAV